MCRGSFAKGDEGGRQHHRIRREVVGMEMVEVEKRAKKAACRQAKAVEEMRPEDDAFTLLRHW